MNIDELLLLGDWNKIIKTLQNSTHVITDSATLRAEFNGKHKINDRAGKVKYDRNGNVVAVTDVARLLFDYQSVIVNNAVVFLFGKPLILTKTSEGGDAAFELLQQTLRELFFDIRNRQLARTVFVEKQAARLYYVHTAADGSRNLRYLLLNCTNGTFIPNYDSDGVLDALLRIYETQVIKNTKIEKQNNFVLYTNTHVYSGIANGSKWEVTTIPNVIGKLPLVYYTQTQEEWANVRPLIENTEKTVSQLCDTNEYFSAPIAKIYGDVAGLPDKAEQGKVLQCNITTDASGQSVRSDVQYLTWDQRPESLQLQLQILKEAIFNLSATPDISFTSILAGKPGNISGVGLRLLFQQALLKSEIKQEVFLPNLYQELTIIRDYLSLIHTQFARDFAEMQITIEFQEALPANIQEIIDVLSVATGGKPIMSVETAVEKNPLVTNVTTELIGIKTNAAETAGAFNI